MNIDQYTKLAIKTESKIPEVVCDKNELNHLLNAMIVIGEMCDALKRKIYYVNSDRYDNFNELASKLVFFAEALNRHHDIRHDEVININPSYLHCALGLGSEIGEAVEAFERAINGKELDLINCSEEILSDLSWYQAIYADAAGHSWSDYLDKNIAKLKQRYGDKFDTERAINRDLESERKILEGKE